jgi:hypothetical protein
MKIEQVEIYKKRYRGTKVTFNSRKGAGRVIEGIATQVVEQGGLVILRDDDNFPHCVSIITLEEV